MRQWKRDTAVLLVSRNISKVLCQVFPVHSCIPFPSLKVPQKKGVYRWRNTEGVKGNEDESKRKTIQFIWDLPKWKMEKIERRSWDEILCASVFSNSPKYWSNLSLGRETVAVLRMRGAHTSTSSSIQQNKLAATVGGEFTLSGRNNHVSTGLQTSGTPLSPASLDAAVCTRQQGYTNSICLQEHAAMTVVQTACGVHCSSIVGNRECII